ncbi:MAG TPA: hypothetical protein VFR81_24515, partial [Longimicrobium sp.]|nr:hypothetical protein [Longimicrobium sp.]
MTRVHRIFGLALLALAAASCRGYEADESDGPDQPIAFYHSVHAGQNQIPWVRIHRVPEHAKFPHYVHTNVGLQCQTCHGPVQEMEKVYQFSS